MNVPGLAPAGDEAGFGELRQNLAHRHPRAAVFRRQFMLEGNAMARRPLAGQDTRFDISENALVQRGRRGRGAPVMRIRRIARSRLVAHIARKRVHRGAEPLFDYVAVLVASVFDELLAATQTRSTRLLSTKIHASRTPSGLSGSIKAWSRFSEIKSGLVRRFPSRVGEASAAGRCRQAPLRKAPYLVETSASPKVHCVLAMREPLRILELAQLVRDANQHVGIRADAEAAALRPKQGGIERPIAKIGLGDRTKPGNGPRGRLVTYRLNLRHMRRMDQAPHRRSTYGCARRCSTGLAPDQARQSSTSLTCSAA